jgi:hypothetical protein
MKIAIIGSRTFSDYELLSTTIKNYLSEHQLNVQSVISGGATGADSLAEKFALENNLKMIVHKPDWKRFGKKAGLVRNTIIIENSDLVFAFWDGKSSGTKDAITKAKKTGKNVIPQTYSESKPKLIVHLDEQQLEQLKSILNYNGKVDLENETFSGTELKIMMSPMGHFLEASGYQKCDIGNVCVELNDK